MKNNTLFIAVAVALVAIVGFGVVVASSVSEVVTSVNNLNSTIASRASDQSNLGGLSEREIQAVSLKVGSPTTKFTVPSTGSSLSVGTSTPTSLGDVVVDGTGTTTLVLSSSSSTKGSCIQMETVTGGVVRIVVTGTTISATAGTCR